VAAPKSSSRRKPGPIEDFQVAIRQLNGFNGSRVSGFALARDDSFIFATWEGCDPGLDPGERVGLHNLFVRCAGLAEIVA
jgi:hypothetical protein